MLTGGGVNWYDVSTGQMIGGGDTLFYAPAQSTFVAGVITDSTGQLHSDTMHYRGFKHYYFYYRVSHCVMGSIST